MFVPGRLRTLQCRVKDWRRLEARRLILADPLDRDADPELARDDPNQVDLAFLIGRPGEDGAPPTAPPFVEGRHSATVRGRGSRSPHWRGGSTFVRTVGSIWL